ncbi:hypothetical protein COBT_003240, partial [Conglomerata obtusa]
MLIKDINMATAAVQTTQESSDMDEVIRELRSRLAILEEIMKDLAILDGQARFILEEMNTNEVMENGNKQMIWELLEFERSGNDLNYEKFISQIKSEIIDKKNRLCEFEKIKKDIEKEKIMRDEINYLENIVYKMKNNVEHKRKRGFGESKVKLLCVGFVGIVVTLAYS